MVALNQNIAQVEVNDDSARVNVYVVFVYMVRARARLGMCICARTTARIRQHGDKEHEEQN